jgi:hypothetical protein
MQNKEGSFGMYFVFYKNDPKKCIEIAYRCCRLSFKAIAFNEHVSATNRWGTNNVPTYMFG